MHALKARIRELTEVSRGIKSFNESANEELSKLRKRKQRLKNISPKLIDKAKNASNLDSTASEITQYEKYIADYQAEIEAKREKLRALKEKLF